MLSLLLSLPVTLALAQDPAAPGGWRRASDSAPEAAAAAAPSVPAAGLDAFGNPRQASAAQPPQSSAVPSQVTIPAGTFVTVRVNQYLSSDRSQPGDSFAATLARPVVVDGVLLASRGQTVSGRVSEAVKAGRIKGTSRLGLELTDLAVMDGRLIPIRSQLVTQSAGTSKGRDAEAVAATTGVGAMVGAAADWGRGAAIGAGAGAAAGVIGVLLTRGRASEVYPEALLTFRLEAPVAVSTERASLAYRWVESGDYERGEQPVRTRPSLQRPPVYYGGPVFWPYPYTYFGTSFYWGRGHHRGWRW